MKKTKRQITATVTPEEWNGRDSLVIRIDGGICVIYYLDTAAHFERYHAKLAELQELGYKLEIKY